MRNSTVEERLESVLEVRSRVQGFDDHLWGTVSDVGYILRTKYRFPLIKGPSFPINGTSFQSLQISRSIKSILANFSSIPTMQFAALSILALLIMHFSASVHANSDYAASCNSISYFSADSQHGFLITADCEDSGIFIVDDAISISSCFANANSELVGVVKCVRKYSLSLSSLCLLISSIAISNIYFSTCYYYHK